MLEVHLQLTYLFGFNGQLFLNLAVNGRIAPDLVDHISGALRRQNAVEFAVQGSGCATVLGH